VALKPRIDGLVGIRSRDGDDAVDVADDQVSGLDRDASDLDRRVDPVALRHRTLRGAPDARAE
jgi:hypothetical protein